MEETTVIIINKSTIDMSNIEAELERKYIEYEYDDDDNLVISNSDDMEEVEEILYHLGIKYYI